MRESDLVNEVARRAGVVRADAEAMLRGLADIAREQARAGTPLALAEFGSGTLATLPVRARTAPAGRDAESLTTASAVRTPCYAPTAGNIEALIAAASRHPLGIEFLLNGDLCAVAVTFQTHAFTVDAARQRIREGGASIAG